MARSSMPNLFESSLSDPSLLNLFNVEADGRDRECTRIEGGAPR